ncbi:MAG TPA: alkaline phosphatase family protein [Thermodesulfobacteriota bacterium]|nr:alkaline phosphatase family protein [Thermodesulfobacteriota bacterium]
MFKRFSVVFIFLISLVSTPVHAYIGPGAGFAILGSFMAFFFAILAALCAVLVSPVRSLIRFIQVKKQGNHPYARRVIVLGLDGLDPSLCEKFMAEGKLPNFTKLSKEGSFRRLKTTLPAMSPVAWSSFATGVNPGKHNIFDFLTPDRGNYLPVLSSTRIRPSEKFLKLGNYRIPLQRPEIQLLRRSQPFWKILGDHWIFSQVIRVPITFPPERFYGAELSAMCVPDLRGSQGSFTYWRTKGAEGKHTGGIELPLERTERGWISYIPGPENTLSKNREEMRINFELRAKRENEFWLILPDQKVKLVERNYTDWIRLRFKTGLGIRVSGLAKFMLLKGGEAPELYLTPINIDPEHPAMPISHPRFYSMYLSKLFGPYATLGLAEDTWALNEHVIDEEAFLSQSWDYYRERKKMLFHCLNRSRKGVLVIVFDHTDRIQHTFFRCLDPSHPLYDTEEAKRYRDAIEQVYVSADELVGEVFQKLRKSDVLFVMSDHGFKSFRKGINVNSWLWKEGYLACKNGVGSTEMFKDVDWSKTRAYALGLSGIYLNLRGRESQGIVEPGEEAQRLRKEICEKLTGLRDPQTGETAIRCAYDAYEHLSGPYLGNAPDVIVGYSEGYRMDWGGTLGEVNDRVFSDNIKSWSGDHCIDPALVPGVLFTNLTMSKEEAWIGDLAPTILRLFDLKIPAYMDGSPLLNQSALETLRKK